MTDHHDHPFDAALRARHQAALERLSPRVQAQLAQRRNAALRGEGSARRGHGLRFAAASFAALFALAIGLQQLRTTPAPAAPATAHIAPTPSVTADSTMLDEDPDFYAWLASPDAQLVAME